MGRDQMHKDFERVMCIPSYVFWSEDCHSYVQAVLNRDQTMTDMCVDEACRAQEKWKVWENAYKTVRHAGAYNTNPVRVLTDALAKVSHSLIAAGNVTPQDWHSDNEKRAFVVMKAMGEEGLEAIARSLMG